MKLKVALQYFLLLFCDISCNFLIIVLITIVSLPLSSNAKLGSNFNCNSNLLMRMYSLLIPNKKYYLAIGWLLIIILVDTSDTVDFWVKDELFYKNLIKRLVLKSQSHNPRNLDERTDFFMIHAKTNSNSRRKKD